MIPCAKLFVKFPLLKSLYRNRIMLIYNSVILIFIYLQMYSLGWVQCASVFPRKEDGTQVLAALVSSSHTLASLLRTP
jgi:hypothetical protein